MYQQLKKENGGTCMQVHRRSSSLITRDMTKIYLTSALYRFSTSDQLITLQKLATYSGRLF